MHNVHEESCFNQRKSGGAWGPACLISSQNEVVVVVVMAELKSFSKFNISQNWLGANYSIFCQISLRVLFSASRKCPSCF